MTKVVQGSHASGALAPPGVESHPVEIRMCSGECGTRLSATNRTRLCGACERHPSGRSLHVVRVECSADGCEETAVKNSEGQRDSRLRRLCAEHYGDALERVFEASRSKTLEGAVPLPGVVRIRERSYAEMIAITPKPRVTHLPVRDTRMRSESGDATPLPKKPAKPKVIARRSNAGARPSRAGHRGGSERTFDYEEAARLMREWKSFKAVAEIIGKSETATATAVRTVLGDKETDRLVCEGRLGGLDAAAVLAEFRETRNVSAIARGVGVPHWRVYHVLKRDLGADELKRMIAERPPERYDATICKRRGCSDPPRPESMLARKGNTYWRICEKHHKALLVEQRERRAASAPKIAPPITCKRDGCTKRPAALRGPYARLCREHVRLMKLERQGVKVTRAPAAVELEAQLDAIEVELEEVAELIRQADEVAA